MGQELAKEELPSSDREAVETAEAMFNSHEKKRIMKMYIQITYPAVPKEELKINVNDPRQFGQFNITDFKEYVRDLLPDDLLVNLFHYMLLVLHQDDRIPRTSTSPKKKNLVSFKDFFVSLYHLLKGLPHEKAKLVICLATGVIGESVTGAQIVKLLELTLKAYITSLHLNHELDTWKLPEDKGEASARFAKYLVRDLIFDKKSPSDDTSNPDLTMAFDEEAIERWLYQCPIFTHMMDTVFNTLYPLTDNEAESPRAKLASIVPQVESVDWDKFLTVLDIPSLLVLNSALPRQLQKKWRFLFSSNLHGQSFSTFVSHVAKKGPTLVIIRDTDGQVFGGFAAEGWERNGNFYGNDTNFLFSLSPKVAIHTTTGYNENYQYFNHGQETIPNGFGFGGQLEHFGLWIDSEFGSGHSRAKPKCTTYNSPQLSAQEHFTIDYLEVWALCEEKKKRADDEEQEATPGSILDKDAGAKAMLSLIGRGPVSEGLREEDPQADIPEEHELPR